MATGALPSFIHREQVIAARLGCTTGFIREERNRHVPGSLWDYGVNRAILWSDEGLALLGKRYLEKTRPPTPEPAAKPPPLPKVEVVRVARCNFPNTRLLQAIDAENRGVIVVGVKAHLFHPGMLILARPAVDQKAPWSFEGNPSAPNLGRRMPRGKADNAWPRYSPPKNHGGLSD